MSWRIVEEVDQDSSVTEACALGAAADGVLVRFYRVDDISHHLTPFCSYLERLGIEAFVEAAGLRGHESDRVANLDQLPLPPSLTHPLSLPLRV